MTRRKIAKSHIIQSPASLGFRMPAEWEPHAATWLGWPHNKTDWPGKFQPIPWVYAEIVRNLARHERVEILVNDKRSEEQARGILDKANALSEAVSFRRAITNRGWMRDSAPIFIKSKKSVAAVNFRFNAWAKYPDWRDDDRASEEIVKWTQLKAWRPEIDGKRVVIEGGSIDVNGDGLMLATEECLLSDVQQRNPGCARHGYEQLFADYLGVEKVIWLGRGVVGDDTHGHVDDISRFVAPRTVVTAIEQNRHDENYAPLRENLRRLEAATDIRGQKLDVTWLPMPAPVIFKGRRLPASYANFYIANGVVLVPVFNDKNDRAALNTLAELFPSREIVPIYCGDLIWGLGAIHCMTQQQPE